MGKNKEVTEMARKVMKKLKEEVEKKSPQVVSHRKWEGRKEQDDELRQYSKEEGVSMADSVET